MWKDFILGLLVAYVALDLLMAWQSQGRYKSTLEYAFAGGVNNSNMWVGIVAIILGLVVWWFAPRHHHH